MNCIWASRVEPRCKYIIIWIVSHHHCLCHKYGCPPDQPHTAPHWAPHWAPIDCGRSLVHPIRPEERERESHIVEQLIVFNVWFYIYFFFFFFFCFFFCFCCCSTACFVSLLSRVFDIHVQRTATTVYVLSHSHSLGQQRTNVCPSFDRSERPKNSGHNGILCWLSLFECVLDRAICDRQPQSRALAHTHMHGETYINILILYTNKSGDLAATGGNWRRHWRIDQPAVLLLPLHIARPWPLRCFCWHSTHVLVRTYVQIITDTVKQVVVPSGCVSCMWPLGACMCSVRMRDYANNNVHRLNAACESSI